MSVMFLFVQFFITQFVILDTLLEIIVLINSVYGLGIAEDTLLGL